MLRIMKSRFPLAAAALTAFATMTLASGLFDAKDDFPPPEKVFRYALESDGKKVTVYWNVAPGYYLYRSRLGLSSGTPGVTLGPPQYPKGQIHHDEYFGDQEIYRDDFTVTAPLTRTDRKARGLTVKLKLQGCADAGLCYPPTVWEARIRFTKDSIRQ